MFDRTPLAVKLRPNSFANIVGQEHLTAPGKIFREMARSRKIQNILLWGPPGSGKTTIAHVLALETGCAFRKIDATTSGVKELRGIIKFAEGEGKGVILAVDEIHRWSKNIQDTLLNAVENNIIYLIGITTETARFAIINALLSRCLVLETNPIDKKALLILYKKIKEYYKSIGKNLKIDKTTLMNLLIRSNGDARKMILVLETLVDIISEDGNITADELDAVFPNKNVFFDKSGSERFNYAHCYQESIQNSDVDSAIYWLAKWLDSGEDPAYISRRMLITAFEDCASNPLAMTTAMAACYTTERVGMPECMIPLSQATCEMAMSKRDKSSYKAIKAAMYDVQNGDTIHVPPELRAGTRGYVKTVDKQYLIGWREDEGDEEDIEQKRGIMYAIGVKKGESFGMINGPLPDLKEMLRTFGEKDACIIKFENDTDEVLYEWNSEEHEWEKPK